MKPRDWWEAHLFGVLHRHGPAIAFKGFVHDHPLMEHAAWEAVTILVESPEVK